MDGEREVLGMWFQETEGAKFWMQVLSELKQRGVSDILICCVDGLKGFPEAIEAIFPQTDGADVHRSPHPRLAALRPAPRYDQVTKDLKPIYTAIDADAALGTRSRRSRPSGVSGSRPSSGLARRVGVRHPVHGLPAGRAPGRSTRRTRSRR